MAWDKFSRTYGPANHPAISITLVNVTINDDEDWFGSGEIFFRYDVDDGISSFNGKSSIYDIGSEESRSFDSSEAKFWNVKHVGNVLRITLKAFDDDVFEVEQLAGDLTFEFNDIFEDFKAWYPDKFGTVELSNAGEGWQAKLRIRVDWTGSNFDASTLISQLSTKVQSMKMSYHKTASNKLINSEELNTVAPATKVAVMPIIEAFVNSKLDSGVSKAFNQLYERKTLTHKEAVDILNQKLESAEKEIDSTLIEQGAVKSKLISEITNVELRTEARKIAEKVFNDTTGSKGETMLSQFPINEAGKSAIRRYIKSISKQMITGITKKLREADDIIYDTLTLAEYYSKLKDEVKMVAASYTDEIETQIINKVKKIMFEQPGKVLDAEVSKKLLSLVNNLDSAGVSGTKGIYESIADNFDGYGLRPKLIREIQKKGEITNVSQLGSKWLPSNTGRINGLGKDMFFDLVMMSSLIKN